MASANARLICHSVTLSPHVGQGALAGVAVLGDKIGPQPRETLAAGLDTSIVHPCPHGHQRMASARHRWIPSNPAVLPHRLQGGVGSKWIDGVEDGRDSAGGAFTR